MGSCPDTGINPRKQLLQSEIILKMASSELLREYSWRSGHLYLNEMICSRPTHCFGRKQQFLRIVNHSLRQST